MKEKFKKGRDGCMNKFLKVIDETVWIRNTLRFLRIRDTRAKNQEFRTIYANQIKPDDYGETSELLDYPSNQVVTSKVPSYHNLTLLDIF